jgi:hypothetical protein
MSGFSETAKLDEFLRSLVKGEHSSISLTWNDGNGPNYMSVKEFDETEFGHSDWVSEEERQRAYEANSCWRLQWYPDTPVGFHSLQASSLEALIEAVAPDTAAPSPPPQSATDTPDR